MRRGKAIPDFLFIAAAAAKSLQSCLTLCNPIDSSPPGSPVPGILQARTLGWVAIAFFGHSVEDNSFFIPHASGLGPQSTVAVRYRKVLYLFVCFVFYSLIPISIPCPSQSQMAHFRNSIWLLVSVYALFPPKLKHEIHCTLFSNCVNWCQQLTCWYSVISSPHPQTGDDNDDYDDKLAFS